MLSFSETLHLHCGQGSLTTALLFILSLCSAQCNIGLNDRKTLAHAEKSSLRAREFSRSQDRANTKMHLENQKHSKKCQASTCQGCRMNICTTADFASLSDAWYHNMSSESKEKTRKVNEHWFEPNSPRAIY
ncbi:hypothetical protein F5890DRAFT_1502736 [Lentinula detonsa]|uniref:Uncharacterized protein n=1 Tax=Lentinula detonsa TaxID=2804962 RepID=A0AA38Q455_9AGAR|nr:hypothetical protein F5890DRAFT_1502736 [Lentinula detonsa]